MNNDFIDLQTNSLENAKSEKLFQSEEIAKLIGAKLLVLPKNSGLEEYRKMLEQSLNEKITVRAEDVPLFVDKLLSKGKQCVGLTGKDLLREYKLKVPFSSVQEIKSFGWTESNTIFGKPVLCLLGPAGQKLNLLEKAWVVAVNKKYYSIAESYFGKLRQKGAKFEKIYFSGATETAFENGLVDFVVDIVVSGKSARKAGLRVYERILESEAILVGGFDGKIQ